MEMAASWKREEKRWEEMQTDDVKQDCSHTKADVERKFCVDVSTNETVTDDEKMLPIRCSSRPVMHCLLNMHLVWISGSCAMKLNACSNVSAPEDVLSGVCVSSDTFIETKEAPVAVPSVAAITAGICHGAVQRMRCFH